MIGIADRQASNYHSISMEGSVRKVDHLACVRYAGKVELDESAKVDGQAACMANIPISLARLLDFLPSPPANRCTTFATEIANIWGLARSADKDRDNAGFTTLL